MNHGMLVKDECDLLLNISLQIIFVPRKYSMEKKPLEFQPFLSCCFFFVHIVRRCFDDCVPLNICSS